MALFEEGYEIQKKHEVDVLKKSLDELEAAERDLLSMRLRMHKFVSNI